MSRITGDRPTTLAMPNQKHSPHNLGIKCGRRERESRREGRREQSLRGKSIPSRVVTVKGILIFWKAARFAVCCRREGLGRSVIRVAVSPATQSRADDSECPEGCRGGERRQHAPQSVCTRRTRKRTLTHAKKKGDASFTRSFDPCTSILATVSTAQVVNTRGARVGITVGQSLGNQERTNTGVGTNGRSAARHISPLQQWRGREVNKKRKEIEVSVPARFESRIINGLVARTSKCAVAEVGRR